MSLRCLVTFRKIQGWNLTFYDHIQIHYNFRTPFLSLDWNRNFAHVILIPIGLLHFDSFFPRFEAKSCSLYIWQCFAYIYLYELCQFYHKIDFSFCIRFLDKKYKESKGIEEQKNINDCVLFCVLCTAEK